MEIIITTVAYILLFYSFYKVSFLIKKNRGKKDLMKMSEVYFLGSIFKVDIQKIGIDKILNIIALSNSIIFTIVLVSTMAISNLILRILAMFILLFPTIYLMCYLVSKYLKKRGF